MFKNFNRQAGSPRSEAGQVSRLLLVLAIIILVAIVITYVVLKSTENAPKPVNQNPVNTIPQPVYEQRLGDIKFVFQQAVDFGGALKGSQSRNPAWQKDVTTTARFIKVTIGAQNGGDQNIKEQVWDLGNIVDSEGRSFTPTQYSIDSWLPSPNLCGTLLKPAFDPTPCVKFYEVSKISKGLRIEVVANHKVGNEYPSGKKDTALIDLIVSQ